jgi:hypothetical protein
VEKEARDPTVNSTFTLLALDVERHSRIACIVLFSASLWVSIATFLAILSIVHWVSLLAEAQPTTASVHILSFAFSSPPVTTGA